MDEKKVYNNKNNIEQDKDKIFEFTGVAEKKVWGNSSDFRIYGFSVVEDEIKRIGLKTNKYENISVKGSIHDLGIGLSYHVKAKETYNNKNGYSYDVINISRDIPKTKKDFYVFLRTILTENQCDSLYNVYPDIVQRVMENRLDDIDLNKTKGIKEKTFSKIKNTIVENYALSDVINEFKGYVTMTMIKKLYDKYASVNAIKEALYKTPYASLCSISGVGFKKADAILLELEDKKIISFEFDLRTSKDRCLACIEYELQQNENNGNTKMDARDLMEHVKSTTPECINKFAESTKSSKIYLSKEDRCIALRATYEAEKYISDSIKYSLNLDNKWHVNADKYYELDGFELSDDQKKIIDLMCDNNVAILNGYSGCGKTASTKALINMLEDNLKSFICLSPTGKAAQNLSEATGRPASTIHRGLCYKPKQGFEYNEYNKLPYDIVILDEMSMVDVFLMSDLLKAIDLNHTKLLIIGDRAQIPSIKAGNILHDMCETKVIPTLTLTKVFRYKSNGMLHVATDVRNGKKYLPNTDKKIIYFGDDNSYAFVNSTDEEIINDVVGIYKKVFSQKFQDEHGYNLNIQDVQVLTTKNVGNYGTIILNNILQKIANKNNYGSDTSIKVGNVTYYEGDFIMQTSNDYHAKLYVDSNYDDSEEDEVLVVNGETGIIKLINTKDRFMVVDFGDKLIKIIDFLNISLAYAITPFKAQGSTISIPIVLTVRSNYFMDNGNITYVALTRAKTRCFHLGNATTINRIIKKKANWDRNTFLQGMLLK